MNPLSIAGLGLGLIGGIGSFFGGRRANRELEALRRNNPVYAVNPIAQQRLGLATTLLNARMPGAASAERNIYGEQANYMNQVNRNATDSSTALAMAAAGQGQTNQSFQNLAQQEAQDYQRRYANYTGAQEGMIAEGDKVQQDRVRRFQDEAQIKAAQNANRMAPWQSLSNLGFGMLGLGMAGGPGGGASAKGPSGYYYGTDSNLPASTYRVPRASYGTPNVQLPG